MLNVLIYGWKDIQLVSEDGCCVSKYESIETAKRAKTLWNMAERLRLTTEEIESGNVETKLKAAPDMLRALEEVMGELDVEGLPCPLCGRDLTIGHRHNCIWHVVASAIQKARGEV